jgi:hypothetical protein
MPETPESSGRVSSPYPRYEIAELHGDLHHLIQPIIGMARMGEPLSAHQIERLYLALALADLASGHPPINDMDVREVRSRHGVGQFQNESAPARVSSSDRAGGEG